MGGEPDSWELGMEDVDLSDYSMATSYSDVMRKVLADNGKIVEQCEASWSSHSD